MAGTAIAERNVPSTGTGSSSATVIPVEIEDREIVVIQGAEFTNAQMRAKGWSNDIIPVWVKKKLPGISVAADDTITYLSEKQKVRFKVRFATTKSALMKACATPGLHVIYSGHARYGRGPCFGPDRKGEHFGRKGTTNDYGLWGMGFPYLLVEEDDIHHHGYTLDVMLTSEGKPPAADCHPELKGFRSSLKAYGKTGTYKIKPETLAFLSPTLGADDKIWGIKIGKDVNFVAKAGWSESMFRPDLGATDMQCRVFCHFGCSTFTHNWKVLRSLKGWTRTGDEHYAYFTTATTGLELDPRWIYYLFKYDKPNAGKSWGPSLSYAVAETNRSLRNAGCAYQVK